jgi:hypothetical protein
LSSSSLGSILAIAFLATVFLAMASSAISTSPSSPPTVRLVRLYVPDLSDATNPTMDEVVGTKPTDPKWTVDRFCAKCRTVDWCEMIDPLSVDLTHPLVAHVGTKCLHVCCRKCAFFTNPYTSGATSAQFACPVCQKDSFCTYIPVWGVTERVVTLIARRRQLEAELDVAESYFHS